MFRNFARNFFYKQRYQVSNQWMPPVTKLANVYESLPIAMNVTQKNILKDKGEKTIVVRQFNAQHQFAERKIGKL